MPYRIALAGLLVLALAWFAVLRPKDDAVTPPPKAPGVEGLGNAVDKAKGVSAQSDASAAATQAAAAAASSGATAAPAASATPAAAATATGAPATASKPAAKQATAPEATGDPSEPIVAELKAGKVAVLLFWSAGAEDTHVRNVLHAIDRHDGKVRIHTARILDVGKYEAITDGVKIQQSPTLVVIGKKLRARTIVGYTDKAEVEQLVNDIGGFQAATRQSYKQLATKTCSDLAEAWEGDRVSLADNDTRYRAIVEDIETAYTAMAGATAPRRYAQFHRAYVHHLGVLRAAGRKYGRALTRGEAKARAAYVAVTGPAFAALAAEAKRAHMKCSA